MGVERVCANCAHWESSDGLTGHCQEITDAASLTPFLIHGLCTCRTARSGCCTRFDESVEARDEARAEAEHLADLRRGAGALYPASLSPAGAYEIERWRRP
jgi:hypothetical protein